MKKVIMTFLTACFVLGGQAQSNIKFVKTTKVASEKEIPFERANLTFPPVNPDFLIVDDDFVNKIVKAFGDFGDELQYYQNTLYLCSNANNSIDSIIVSEGENNSYLAKKRDGKWYAANLTLKGSNTTLRHIVPGQTFKEVCKLLNKKPIAKVVDGTIWVSDKDNKYHFVFTFSKEKLISIQL